MRGSFRAWACLAGAAAWTLLVLPRALPATPECFGEAATKVGTRGADTLRGTAGDDVIVGLGGNDTIEGRGGGDRLCGGDGRDRLLGEGGGDRLAGDAGDDELQGGSGRDTASGGTGVDVCWDAARRSACETASLWPMFHADYRHRGFARVSGPTTNDVAWSYDLGGIPGSVAVDGGGRIYVGGGGQIVALSPDGSLQWSQSYTNAVGPAVAPDGTIYFLADTAIVSLSPDGSERWTYDTGGRTIFGPTVAPDGTIYQGSWDGYAYALNPDGTLKWRYQTEGSVSYPITVADDGKVYVGGGDVNDVPDGNLYSLTTGGSLRWAYDSGTQRVGSPASVNGLVLGPAAPYLLAIDTTGSLQWKKPETPCPPAPAECTDPDVGVLTPAIGPDGTIYTGNSSGVVQAIDPSTQATLWSYQTGGGEPSTQGVQGFPVVDGNGNVYVGSADGQVYAIDADGNLMWTYQTGDKITESSPAFGPDGTLYVTSEDGFLYAFGA